MEVVLSEPNERIIIGVAKVHADIGSIQNYKFPEGYSGHKGYPWDRFIEHTLRPKNQQGFLMPYHEIIEYSKDNEIELSEYKVVAPSFEQFSYASELVDHDTAIDSLLNMAETLRKSELILDKKFDKELEWIDNEISNIWDMRGAFPGMNVGVAGLSLDSEDVINMWQILAISVAEIVAENKKPPDNQEVLSFDMQSVGE